MLLYDLGMVDWRESQLLYHALCHMGREALCLCRPASPYVSLGYSQQAEQDLDLDYCRAQGIPVFRREVGGGGVYLDRDQLFFQLVLRAGHPLINFDRLAFYRRVLGPAILACRDLGVAAELAQPNDIVARGRKLSGTGAGEVGQGVAFVGNILMDCDHRAMARVLAAPHPGFRRSLEQSMGRNLTSLRRELGAPGPHTWSSGLLRRFLARRFAELLGPLQSVRPDQALRDKMAELEQWMFSQDWLHRRGRRRAHARVKIRSGIYVIHRMHATSQGCLRVNLEVEQGRYGQVRLDGHWPGLEPREMRQVGDCLRGASVEGLEDALSRLWPDELRHFSGLSTPELRALFQPGPLN